MLNKQLADSWQWQRGGHLPAWLLSLALHSTLLTTLGLTVQATPQPAVEPTREGGIVLVARTAANVEYFSDETSDISAADGAEVFDQFQQPFFSGPQLPTPVEPPIETAPGLVFSSTRLPEHSSAARQWPDRKHTTATETQVFGVRGRGRRFVYVFDRSSSMEGPPLVAAKLELIASLQNLESVHQFQIIFYNQQPQLMPAFRGQSQQMVFGDDQGKRQAATFVGGIFAHGATDHLQALRTALQMRPDVVFFLTDADEPQLQAGDFHVIRRLNQGTIINAIEFGHGSPKTRFSFLQQLAAENGGQHTYVDVTRLAR